MHLNETNYYMLTAFTMARLKEPGSFNLALRELLSGEVIPLTVCISELSLFLQLFFNSLTPAARAAAPLS